MHASQASQSEQPDWHQLNIQFGKPHTAEDTAVSYLGPALEEAQSTGLTTTWFFIRKPWWRVRYIPTSASSAHSTKTYIAQVMNDHGRIAEGIYEPEIHAFGGELAMATAHDLFHADSHHILAYLARHRQTNTDDDRRREISIILCTALMRAAGQDRYEQGDIWAKVADHRPAPTSPAPPQWGRLTSAIRKLTAVDSSYSSGIRNDGSALAAADQWLTHFEHAGQRLHTLANEGSLTRGIRAILAHHIIFHWNRIGLNVQTQANLATAAKEAIFHDAPSIAVGKRPRLGHADW